MIETGKYNPYNTSGGEMFAAFRRFFLGKKFPDTYTRIICNLGIISFLYNFCWSLMVLLLLDFGTGLPRYYEWETLFMKYGKQYGIFDMVFSFHTFVIGVLVFSVTLLTGVILVWRQKPGGYALVIGSQIFLIALPFLILGSLYFQNEVRTYEWGSAALISLLFLIGYFIKRRK